MSTPAKAGARTYAPKNTKSKAKPRPTQRSAEVRDFLAAYEATGLVPTLYAYAITPAWRGGPVCGCPLTAFALEQAGLSAQDLVTRSVGSGQLAATAYALIQEYAGLSPQQILDFTEGVDGFQPSNETCAPENPSYEYQLGRAVRLTLRAKGLVETNARLEQADAGQEAVSVAS